MKMRTYTLLTTVGFILFVFNYLLTLVKLDSWTTLWFPKVGAILIVIGSIWFIIEGVKR